MTIDRLLADYAATQTALHALWTSAVGTPGYDKAAWIALGNAIDRLARDAATAAGYPKDKSLVTP